MIRAAALVAVLSATRLAHADGDAEKLYQDGQTAYDAKRYDDAVAAWDKAYALSKLPALMFNLAQAHRLGGHCTKAVEAYKRFLSLDPASDEKPSAEQFLRELEPCADAPKQPPHDDHTAPKIIGQHVEDHGGGKRRAGLIVGGTGLALFATGLYFGSRASSLANEVETACEMGCEWTPELADKESSGKSAQTIQYVLVAAGAVGLVGGAALYYLGRSDKHIVFEYAKTGGAVGVAGRF